MQSALSPTQGAYPTQGAFAGTGAAASQPAGTNSPFDVSTRPSVSASEPGSSGNSASRIIVQPQQAKRGERVLISWTSVNMKTSSCAVLKNEAAFATGSEGSRPDQLASGATTFTLTCSDSKGERVQSTVSISVPPVQ